MVTASQSNEPCIQCQGLKRKTEFWSITQAKAVQTIKYRDSYLLRSPLDPEEGGISIFRNAEEIQNNKT